MRTNFRAITLYTMSVVGSGAGFVTQMLVSGFWATAFSHDVFHFSVNLAFYFLSLGIGSLLSERIEKPEIRHLFLVNLALCLWTGVAISLLRIGIATLGSGAWMPIVTVSVAGALAGTVIPLTLRIGKATQGVSLSILLFLDYTAAIVFSALFTFVLLIPYGYGMTALLLSFACLVVTAALLVQAQLPGWLPATLAALAAVLPYPVHNVARMSTEWARNPADTTQVVFARQSHYQKIVMTKEKGTGSFFPGVDQHVLYLDGMVQFTSFDEQSYHACIANIPETAAEYVGNQAQTALILGGGDGLVARNLLSLPRIKKVTQVELDPAMIEFALGNPQMRSYNLDSLRSPRVEIVLKDAFHWVRNATEQYDLVIIDFPHPRNITLARLFSAEFYSYVKRVVKPNGFIAIQAGPSISLEDRTLLTLAAAPVAIRETVRSVGLNASIYVSTRDEEAFVLATPSPTFDMHAFAKKIGIVGLTGMGLICSYNPEWKEPKVAINTLNTHTVSKYMLDWYKKAGGIFFNYKGAQGVFLPD